ncbi:hypothetical protein GIB67_040504 [Kingdonia uniflora]|uniref:Uncharacterized protein n=1 Tax=Kingdonia uniflora TaxID=39325 RepID=A0A7J7L599_9MAGN|nr:hypothetical protein GIB67_040504 [Kingdonia uniflora]
MPVLSPRQRRGIEKSSLESEADWSPPKWRDLWGCQSSDRLSCSQVRCRCHLTLHELDDGLLRSGRAETRLHR